MRVLVTGAYGLIGSPLVARLLRDGHDVVGVGRRIDRPARSLPRATWIAIDFASARAEDWLPHLSGIDAVVNAVGVLQHGPDDPIDRIQVAGTDALFAACERQGVRRVIHISAIGVDRDQPSEFSRTKLAGERALAARDLDWVVLRPAFVLGRAAYGGSALFRGLTALPGFVPVLPDSGELSIVHVDDLVAAIVFFLDPRAPKEIALDIAAPERMRLTELLLAYRRWLGLPEPRLFPVPRVLAALAFRLGDAVGQLGWRPPIRSNAALEMTRGAVGDTTEWTRITAIAPQSLAAALAAEPASVQERWFARLYFLKPLTFAILSVFWIATGLLALGPGYGHGQALMNEAGVPWFGPIAIIGGGLLDLGVGIGIAWRRTTRTALIGSLGVSLFYVAIGTALVPRLWIDPLGPMTKIWPILVLTLIALAILEDR